MSDEGYNGWRNYPTWCVNLWLDNDPGSQEWALQIVRDAIDGEQHPRYAASSALKHEVRDMIETEDASMASDLLGYALDMVDWYEIADAYIELAAELVDA